MIIAFIIAVIGIHEIATTRKRQRRQYYRLNDDVRLLWAQRFHPSTSNE